MAITQALRLLNACPAVLSATAAGPNPAGHARALVGLPTPEAQEQGLKVALARNLSVREMERWVREYRPTEPRVRARRHRRSEEPIDPEMASLVERLQERFGSSVSVTGSPSRGQISFHYASSEELQGLLGVLLG